MTLGELARHKGVDLLEYLDAGLAALRAVPLSRLDRGRREELAHRVPKIDLHRHLEGAISPETLVDVARKYDIPLPSYDVEELRPHVQITPNDKSLLDFLKKFDVIGKVFVNREAIRDITYGVIQDAHNDNIPYHELRFSPMYMAAAHNLDLEDVIKGVLEGVDLASKKLGSKVNLILIVERQMGVEPAWVVEKLAEKYKDRGVVALDLANDEFHYPPGPYAEVFQAAKKAGLGVTVHAGEAGGPENVETSIVDLEADRVGHGVRTYQDGDVEDLVRYNRTPLELAFTSNLQTQAVENAEDYPLPRYQRRGLLSTLNTDDPGVEGVTLSHEVAEVSQRFNLGIGDLWNLTLNSVAAAFLGPREKLDLGRKVDQGFNEATRWLAESLTVDEFKALTLEAVGNMLLPESQHEKMRAQIQSGLDWLVAG